MRSQSVRELSFMGPSNDGKRLLLVAADGTQFELVVDSRLISVVSREHGPAVSPPSAVGTPKMPSPRDIQTQVRHGATVEQIAEAAGVNVDDVAKFAYPVITERAHIADTARAALVKVGNEPEPLEKAVLDRLKTRAVDTRLIRWDAWRTDGTVWTVIVAYPANQGERIASFSYDAAAKTITAKDDEARRMLEVGEAESDTVTAAPQSAPKPATQHPRPHVVANPPAEEARPAPATQAAPPPQTRSEAMRAEAAAQPKSWDRAHPAARAHERREANGDSNRSAAPTARPAEPARVNPEHPAATTPASSGGETQQRRAPEADNNAPAKPAPKPAPKKEETPQWEELLFGSPQHDDSN